MSGRGPSARSGAAPSVKEKGWSEAVLELFAADPQLEWVPVVGSGNRPLAVAGRPLGLNVEPRLAGIEQVRPDETLPEASRRALARPGLGAAGAADPLRQPRALRGRGARRADHRRAG